MLESKEIKETNKEKHMSRNFVPKVLESVTKLSVQTINFVLGYHPHRNFGCIGASLRTCPLISDWCVRQASSSICSVPLLMIYTMDTAIDGCKQRKGSCHCQPPLVNSSMPLHSSPMVHRKKSMLNIYLA